MVMSKRMMIVFRLCLVMACAIFVREAEANSGYEAINKGNAVPCGLNNKQNCKMRPPANEYQKGCSHGEYCRDGHNEKEDGKN
ncbi:hypothetical protein ACOSP7_002799 [Xanthoceras sorbifolium]